MQEKHTMIYIFKYTPIYFEEFFYVVFNKL